MLQDKIKELRKSKGMTQEELAFKLNIVRQTVSKWEKGLSVPDADMIIEISELFEISVSELLGAEIKAENEIEVNLIAEQLSRINEQLAIKNKRGQNYFKILLIILFVVFILPIILVAILSVINLIGFTAFSQEQTVTTQIQEVMIVSKNENGDFKAELSATAIAELISIQEFSEGQEITLKISSNENCDLAVNFINADLHAVENSQMIYLNANSEQIINLEAVKNGDYYLSIENMSDNTINVFGNIEY